MHRLIDSLPRVYSMKQISFIQRVFVPLWAAAALSLPCARATSVIAPSFEDLVAKADCIFTGNVTGLRSEWTGDGEKRRIVTYVTFNVVRVLKGEAASPFTLRVLGGTVGTETLEVADAPVFRIGEREVLFVHDNGRQFIPLVGIMHGQYRVDAADRITDHAGRPVAQVEDLGAPASLDTALRRRAVATVGNNGAPIALSRTDFEAKIIAKMEAQRANAQ